MPGKETPSYFERSFDIFPMGNGIYFVSAETPKTCGDLPFKLPRATVREGRFM
jgi:hypothetical protein